MKINLLPQEYRPKPLVSPGRLFLMMAGSVLFFAALGGMVLQYFLIRNEEEMLANIRTQLEIRQEPLKTVTELENRKAKILQKRAEITKIINMYPSYNGLLQVLAISLKSDMWLMNVEFAPSGSCKIESESLFFPTIGDFLKSLTGTEEFRLARLTDVDEVTPDEDMKAFYKFNLEIETGKGAPEYASKN